MKRTFVFTAVVALAALLSSCSLDKKNPVDSPDPTPSAGSAVIPVGQTRLIQPHGLEVTFDTVLLDNRCPIGAMCFWSGMAIVRLEVATSASDRQAVIFHHDPGQPAPDSSRYVVTSAGKFRINLRSLDPYPSIDSVFTYEDYSVTVSVSTFQAGDGVIGEVVPSRLPKSTLIGDAVLADSFEIDGRELTFSITYSGGCHRHQFTLFMAPPVFAESDPAQAGLYLYHYADHDPCDAVLREQVTFSLEPVIELYRKYYGRDDPIRLNLHDAPDDVWHERGRVLYEPPEVEPPPILPMAIGNYWIYADTSWYGGVPEASLDTIEVIDYITDSLGDWWVLSQSFYELGNRIMLKGDTVCALNYGLGGPYPGLEYIPPSADSAVVYMVVRGCLGFDRTVVESDSTIVTPAGTFGGLWEYFDAFNCDVRQHQFVRPGVGFVYSVQPECSWYFSGSYARRTWLVEYQVTD